MKKTTDEFARIALEGGRQSKNELEEPCPLQVECPVWLLEESAKGEDPDPAGTYQEPVMDEATLSRELDALRNKMAPFLQRHAPCLEQTRRRLELRQFSYCQLDHEHGEAGLMAGRGELAWEQVILPHYGGPTGRATAAYRTTFAGGELERGSDEYVWMCFEGVDYRCRVYLNGVCVGAHEGFFEAFDFNVTGVIEEAENTLLVIVENDAPTKGFQTEYGTVDGDKIYAATGLGWDDPELGWHHCPPGMGICNRVFLETRPTLFIRDIFVRPLQDLESAEVRLEIFSHGPLPRSGSLELSLYGDNFEQEILTGQEESINEPGPGPNTYRLSVPLPDARLWSPECPWLYVLQCAIRDESGSMLDHGERVFGMRTFRMETYRGRQGMFFLNDKPLRLRGANTMGHEQQCVFKGDYEQLIDDILLSRLANMNFWRLTQRPVQREVYDYCDRLGLLTQTDLPLFGLLRRNQFAEAVRQAGAMERHVRGHPCNILVSYINEPFPDKPAKIHRHLTREELHRFFRAADEAVLLENPDRVIKAVDGDYDPPAPGLPDNHCYCGWYNGHGIALGKLHRGYWQRVKPDWYYACGEYGAEGLESIEMMRRHYPAHWLPECEEDEATWTPNAIVLAQTGNYYPVWFVRPNTLEGWIERSQAHQAWATQIMTEAFRRDPRMVSFAIHLGIDAFPAGWMKAIMDCERRPKPAYFAYRRALEPLMVSLRSDRRFLSAGETVDTEVWLCNDTPYAYEKLSLKFFLKDKEGGIFLRGQEARLSIRENDSACVGKIRFKTPLVDSRREITLQAVLFDEKNQGMNHSEIHFSLFPEDRHPDISVCAWGTDAETLIKISGGNPLSLNALPSTGVLLVSDLYQYEEHRDEVDELLNEGLRVVFLNLPQGSHTVAGEEVGVDECHFHPVIFLSPRTEHPWTLEFRDDDFFFWYGEEMDYTVPLASTFLEVDDSFRSLLETGDIRWGRPFHPDYYRPVAAEKRVGLGRVVFCQVTMKETLRCNPPAMRFFRNLLTME